MQYIIYLFLFLLILLFLKLWLCQRKKSRLALKELNSQFENYRQRKTEEIIAEQRAEIELNVRHEIKSLLSQKEEIDQIIKDKTEYVESLVSQIRSINQTLEEQRIRARTYEEQLRSAAISNAKRYEQTLMDIAKEKVELQQNEIQKAAELAHAETMAKLSEQAEAARAQIEIFTREIAEYSAKQAAINEAILRQRAIEEQQDFYRVCLAPETANDVEILNAARRNLKKPEIIDKIIYDNYIAKPVLEMIKRVLQNTTCSGIYKITCLKTGEIYIGKSTDIKNRWQQHCKTVFNCGTIASSLLHTKMKQHGIDNFTFELVEQVPKDQLSEREKFYISFYQSKEVGLNERQG